MRCACECLALAFALVIVGCRDDGGEAVADGGDSGEATSASGGSDGATEGATEATAGDDSGSGGDSGSETGGDWASLAERPCPDDSFLTFENFGAMHLLNYCTGCHASGLPAGERQMAPIEINFDDLDDVRAHADRIWARAADANATMPPAGSAPDEERAWLGEWLACGAPTSADLDADTE